MSNNEQTNNTTANEDQEYQVFSNLMDAIFDLANDLCDKKRLSKNEKKLLKAMDEYCASWEENENNEQTIN